MKELQKVENSLEKALKGLPNISEKAKESWANALPVLVIIGSVLNLLAARSLWMLTNSLEQAENFVRSYAVLSDTEYSVSGSNKLLIYLGVAVLVVEAVLLLMSYKELKLRKKRGWDLVFLSMLVGVVYYVLELFITGRGFGGFLFGFVITGFWLWLLFQVKSKYGAGKLAKKFSVKTAKK